MSTIGFHISGNPSGLDEVLTRCAHAGSPVSMIYSVNQNIAASIADHSPTTKWVYRRQTDAFNRLPDDFYNGDAVASARAWLIGKRDPGDRRRTQVENWLLNPADWYDPLNEPVIEVADPNDPAQIAEAVRRARWLNQWLLEALTIAESYRLRLALLSYASESGTLLPAVWNELVPMLTLGKRLGAILSLHAYGGAADETTGSLADRPQAYLRHAQILALLPPEAQLPIIYSECGADNGYDTGHSSQGMHFIDDLAACDVGWMADARVLGACAFQLGGSESNYAAMMPQFGDYIAAHPTPAPVPPREPPDDGIPLPPLHLRMRGGPGTFIENLIDPRLPNGRVVVRRAPDVRVE